MELEDCLFFPTSMPPCQHRLLYDVGKAKIKLIVVNIVLYLVI